jgi:hypothetical protein
MSDQKPKRNARKTPTVKDAKGRFTQEVKK